MTDPDRIAASDRILRDWLDMPGTACAIGDFANGAVAELMLTGARLSPPRYGGAHAGLRDLTMAADGHHAHLDLGRIDTVVYRVHPVVCFGWKPGLCCALGDAITLMVSDTWPAGRLDETAFLAYLTMYARHRAAWPDLVSLDARCRRDAGAHEREAVDMMLKAAQAIDDVTIAQALRTSLAQAGA